ncbi:hypothetical protein GCM10023168_24020 [Fodinibacter luteus]|uniref:O-antigen ligase-related domain-containing protein n=1 Tax=Fodinibacter luteus TaxID=552064 RepID=A0ABP8KJA6_9MICO
MRRTLPHLDIAERVGVVLVLASIAWSVIASLLAGRMPSLTSPYVLAPVVLAGGVGLGRLVATRARSEHVVAALVVVTTVLYLGVIWTDGPAKRPTAYANANAAVAVQVIGLAGLAMLGADRTRRVVLWLTAAGAVAVIDANASRAAFVVAVPLLAAIALMAWHPARRRAWALALGAVSMLVAAGCILVLASRPSWPAPVSRGLDPTRNQLWHDALNLWRQHPVTGGGPGSFEDYSALAKDADTVAAHSSLLQVGSETGIVGAVLLGLLTLTGLAIAARGAAPYTVVGAAAWTALGLHSLGDHLLEYAPIVIAAGMALGWAGASRSEELDVSEGERPVPG